MTYIKRMFAALKEVFMVNLKESPDADLSADKKNPKRKADRQAEAVWNSEGGQN